MATMAEPADTWLSDQYSHPLPQTVRSPLRMAPKPSLHRHRFFQWRAIRQNPKSQIQAGIRVKAYQRRQRVIALLQLWAALRGDRICSENRKPASQETESLRRNRHDTSSECCPQSNSANALQSERLSYTQRLCWCLSL